MEGIRVNKVSLNGNRIEVDYSVSEGLQHFFDTSQNVFWAEYSQNVSTVPESIAVIPFVCNVIPIIWLTDTLLDLPSIDKSFFENLDKIKSGYEKMYPMFNFKGKIHAINIIDNSYCTNGGNAVFFSGGVDAFTTLIRHREEYPLLITVRGADIRLDDIEGWEKVSKHVHSTSKQFNLSVPSYVASNFRTFINEESLSVIVEKSKDGWWHGFQHGIGILSHAAPLAWINHLDKIYIASSNTANEKTTCASDPTIDNYLHFGSSHIIHDAYELNRQQKIQTIVNYCKQTNQKIEPRVCWVSSGGENCCKCEKCIRTIFSLLAENEPVSQYGFKCTDRDLQNSKKIITDSLYVSNDSVKGNWVYVIKRFQETGAYKYDKRINWVYKLNPYASPPRPSIVHIIYHKVKRSIRVFFNPNNSTRP